MGRLGYELGICTCTVFSIYLPDLTVCTLLDSNFNQHVCVWVVKLAYSVKPSFVKDFMTSFLCSIQKSMLVHSYNNYDHTLPFN